MPKFEDHECLLPRQEEDIIKQFIDTGMFISMRRRIRSLCMIDQGHPDTRKFFKSHAARRNEEIRHLVHNYHMIHPFSKLNLYWEFYMFFVFALQFIVIPIDASHKHLNSLSQLARFILDTLQIGDMIKLFFTGFYYHKRNSVILDCPLVSKRYLKSYFFVDLISSAYCYTYPLRVTEILQLNHSFSMPISLLNRLKIFRLPRWFSILELFRQYMGYSNYLFKGIKVVLVFFVVTLWAFSINLFVEHYVDAGTAASHLDSFTKFVDKYYEVTLLLLLVGYNRSDVRNWLNYINIIFFLCFGFALHLFIHAQILQVWTKYASAESKHIALHKQIKEYMKYKELPVTLRERIFSYFQFKFHKQFFKETDINSMVSPLLRQEILLHVTRNHIEKVEFFRYLPENILMKVVAQLRSEIFLPGDVIITSGSVGTSMFLIYHGTVAVYSPSGKELCHLEDGAHFGEIALILSEKRVATVIAVTASELFMLKRSDFLAVIEPFPAFRDQLVALATERMRTVLHSDESEL